MAIVNLSTGPLFSRPELRLSVCGVLQRSFLIPPRFTSLLQKVLLSMKLDLTQ